MEKPSPGFFDGGIGMGHSDLSIPPPPLGPQPTSGIGMPIKTHILKIGNSAAAVIPVQLLRQLGFKIGDYITITIKSRKPDEDEMARDERKKKKA